MGVTGHRPERLRENNAELGRLRRQADAVLRGIAVTVAELRQHEMARTPYAAEPPRLRLISALAEGSDRLLARVALNLRPCAYELQCVFPFPAEVYRRDFSERSEWQTRGSVQDFDALRARATAVLELDSERDAPNAYAAVGLTLVRQCDVLLAIWDGAESRGPGGTPEVVLEALRANIPVIAIDARRSRDHAIALVELHHGVMQWRGWSLGELRERLHTVFFLPPDTAEDDDPIAPRGGGHPAPALFDEPDDDPSPNRLYSLAVDEAAALVGDAEFRPLLTAELSAFVDAVPSGAPSGDEQRWPTDGLLSREVRRDVPPALRTPALRRLVHQLEEAAGRPFTWSDRQATRYAALHRRHVARSTLLLIPIGIVAGFLVQRCLTSGLLGYGWPGTLLRVALAFAELGVLTAIFYSYVTVRQHRYHERWLDYRSVAEKLRHILMLLPLGRPGIDAELPPTLGENDPRAHWTNWYVRAVTREAGVMSGSLADPAWRDACHTLLRHWLVRGQIRYHFHAASRAHAPKHVLHQYRYAVFGLVVLAPVVDLLTELMSPTQEHLKMLIECLAELVLFCVPAIVGSWYAFTRLSDFENIEVRSRAELQRLVRVERELAERADRSSADLLRATSMTSHAMLAELVEWRVAAALREPDLGH